MQTGSCESSVTVKWDESELTPPPGTVILIYKSESLEVDYPVMSTAAPWVFHPKWGIGKYEDEDEEHIFYRFNEIEVHTGGKKF